MRFPISYILYSHPVHSSLYVASVAAIFDFTKSTFLKKNVCLIPEYFCLHSEGVIHHLWGMFPPFTSANYYSSFPPPSTDK